MIIEIGDKYTIESSTHDFILYEKRIVQHGETKGKETKGRLGFYPKIEQLIRALIVHDIKQSDVKSLQEMEQHIDRVAAQCAKAFSGASA